MRSQIKLQSEIEQAKAMAQYPMLLRLRKINALQEMAKQGGKFAIALRDEKLASMFDAQK